MTVREEDLENLENIEDFENEDEEFEDTPESRGDILKDDTDEEDDYEDPPEEVDTDEVPDEEESEEEPEEEVPEEELETAPPDPKANVRVPLSRLDAEIARRKELEEKLARIGERDSKSEKQTNRMTEIHGRLEELDELMAKATLEGDDKEFRKLRAEDRSLNNELMDMRLQESTQRAVSQTRFDTTRDLLESKYPVLNPDSDEFDQGLVDEVSDLLDAFTRQGNAPHVALKRAVSYVIRDVPEEPLSQEPGKPKGLRKQARSTDTPRERNRQAKKQMAPSTAGRRSVEEPEKSVFDMSDEEFDRFYNSKAGREARGDFMN